MTVFSIILAIIYFIVGAAKVAGAKPMAEQFEEFGLSNVSMRVIGGLEVAAAIGMFIDPLPMWAALGMVAMMIGAILNHRKAGHPIQQTTPAIVVLVASAAFVALSL